MKISIKNRYGKRIAILLERSENSKGLAFVAHGLGGFKEQPQIATIAEAFLESGYNVVRFDACHTLGESEGNFEDATTTNYYEDLVDVINWVKSQSWFRKPFCIAGHSLGGMTTALYAENHPEEVKALAPLSTVVSWRLSSEKEDFKKISGEWKRTGWHVEESISKPGVLKKLKWSFVEDRLKYDLLEKAENLVMPVLLIVGEDDTSTPPEHQRILYDKIPGKKELHLIKGAQHTFRDPEHLKEIKAIIKSWLSGI